MSDIGASLSAMHSWLTSIHDDRGYGGPVSHWWESSLLYSGYMIDWRYEGIICGYVTLFQKTGDVAWLNAAVLAADDCVDAQMPNGNYRNSAFQQGPMEAGTPHEVAVDMGLLVLADALKNRGDDRWERYFQAAEANLKGFYIDQLWNGKGFLDQAWNTTLVPNKNATTIEALMRYESLSGEDMSDYIKTAAQVILGAQVPAGQAREGGYVHLGTGPHQLAIGIYTARSVSALVKLYDKYGDETYLESARRAGTFMQRLIDPKGTYFGYYKDNRLITSPTWVSPSGDCLRAFHLLAPHMDTQDSITRLTQTLIDHQHTSGGMYTAHNLGHKGGVRPRNGTPDFRDVLPVAGWCDKTFRAFALLYDAATGTASPTVEAQPAEVACVWKGKDCLYEETADYMQVREKRGRRIIYKWHKRTSYPEVFEL